MPLKLGAKSSSGTHPALTETFKPHAVRRADVVSPVVMFVLALISVAFIKSAQGYNGGTQWHQQIVWLVLGAGIYLTVSSVDYHVWLRNAHWIYLGGFVALLMLWSPLGEVRSGARRWVGVGSYTLQPSEFAKIGTLVMIAAVLARADLGTVRDSLQMLFKIALVVMLPMVLIFKEPDLGSSLVLFPMVFAQLYVSNLSARFFVTVFGIFLLCIGVLGWDIKNYQSYLQENKLTPKEAHGQYEKRSWLPLKDYMRDRVAVFLAPKAVDREGTGVSWNQNQSLIAVGSGGWSGKGYENGTQARLGYLPSKVTTSDFFMAVLLEEKGFLGGIAVLCLYAILLGNTLRIAGLARDRFGQQLCVGVAVVFMVHVFVNIGMVQGLMPVKGIPLPLLSYGGTFVLTCCALMGLVQSVYRHRREAV